MNKYNLTLHKSSLSRKREIAKAISRGDIKKMVAKYGLSRARLYVLAKEARNGVKK